MTVCKTAWVQITPEDRHVAIAAIAQQQRSAAQDAPP